MNEDQATRLFDALGEGVPDRRPPIPELVAAGRTAVRRRTRRTMALAAASVAVALGGGAVVQRVFADDDRRGSVADLGPEDGPNDLSPEGVRLVGGHRVVVEVPDSWVADDGCGPTRGALLNVQEPGASQLALSITLDLIPLVIGIAVLLILRAIVGSIKDGDPFGRANVGRLRKLGIILVAFPVVAIVMSVLLGGILDSTPSARLLNNSFSLDFAPVAAGLGVLVLAEVFAQGVRMREEIEGTV